MDYVHGVREEPYAVMRRRIDGLPALVALLDEENERIRCQGYFALSAAERATAHLPAAAQAPMQAMIAKAREQLSDARPDAWMERKCPFHQPLPSVPHLQELWYATRGALSSEWFELSPEEIPQQFLAIAVAMARKRAGADAADAAGAQAHAEELAAQRADLEEHLLDVTIAMQC